MLLQALCIISYPLVNSNWSYSPETPNLGQIRWFLAPCDLEIWRMTLKNNRAPLLSNIKLYVSFHHHMWIQLTLLKINRLLHIYIYIVPLKFGVDIQGQIKVRVWKPKNPIWLPGGHFESDVTENQQVSACDHHQHAYEVWNWNSKANLSYTPETMPPTESRSRKI